MFDMQKWLRNEAKAS